MQESTERAIAYTSLAFLYFVFVAFGPFFTLVTGPFQKHYFQDVRRCPIAMLCLMSGGTQNTCVPAGEGDSCLAVEL